MRPFLLLYASLCVAVSCSAFGRWPYPDDSHPTLGSENPRQRPVQALTPVTANVCHLTTARSNYKHVWLPGWWVGADGSAALIEGRYLLTAAHNVSDYPGANRLMRLEVRCATTVASSKDADVVLERGQIERQVFVPRYAMRVWSPRHKQFEFDYAFVDLGRPLNIPSAFSLDPAVRPESPIRVMLGGFPGGEISNTDSLFVGLGRVTDHVGNLISYDIATATGNSGGPVWTEQDGRAALVGIHVEDRAARIVDSLLYSDWTTWRAMRARADSGR